MKIENGRIIQASVKELYLMWLNEGWDDVYSFQEFLYRMGAAGVKVTGKKPATTLAQRCGVFF